MPEEFEWKQQIADGDQSAFSALFNEYYNQLRPFIWKFTKDQNETEEILQETFIRVWLNRDKLPGIEKLRNWIFTIAARLCLSHLRKTFNEKKKITVHHQEQQYVETDTPEHHYDAGEISRLVSEAVRDMPPQRRKIYRMSREEGLKPSDIASELSVSTSTVKNSLVTALKDIRKHLLDAGYPLSLLLILQLLTKK